VSKIKKYRAFGLNIESEVDMNEIEESCFEKSDVRISYGHVEKPKNVSKEDKHGNTIYKKKNGKITSYVEGFGGFKIENRNSIKVHPEKDPEKTGFRFFVFGTGMALLLHVRGVVVLHGSAICIKNKIIGFIGNSGSGKSTTAALFNSEGYPLFTDDVLAVDIENDKVMAYKGSPYIKLNPDSAERVTGKRASRLGKVYPSSPKRVYEPKNEKKLDKREVEKIYVINRKSRKKSTEKVSEKKIGGEESCMRLIENAYVPRLLGKEAICAEHFEKTCIIASKTKVCLLETKDSLDKSDQIVRYIEKFE
jgi:hypothetical protein